MTLLIADLDNTLYDWVTYYANAFEELVKCLAKFLDVDESELLEEFRLINQRYGDSEQRAAIFELPSVKRKYCNATRKALLHELAEPLFAFDRARDYHLKLYPGVYETLSKLLECGVTIVGHTEASADNALDRLTRLDIAQYFHHLYALEATGPILNDENESIARDRYYDKSVSSDLVQIIPRTERKPNPQLLADICRRERTPTNLAWYVGDSLIRDMSMAQEAGVASIWAKYGLQYDKALWNLLVRITHWTEEDVVREAKLRNEFGSVKPDYEIQSFGEIIDIIGCKSPNTSHRSEFSHLRADHVPVA